MNNKGHSYKIIPELNLIIRRFKGRYSIPEIIQVTEIFSNDKGYLPTMNHLVDIKEAEILANDDDIFELVDYYKASKKVYAKRKTVLLTETPDQVVFGTLLNHYKNEKLVELSVVSTLDPALSILGIPLSNKTIIRNIIS